ncbi:MAG: tRNA dihydrouridine synthase DusB [Deltaproteobacteria bacterium HGW-Deltaproteobacteria-10]|nr:MAG: tRNA dihydrouridine synthase DusB [Deltaproteobacteria bacterium HGW-Deltaproteobacteria-10]
MLDIINSLQGKAFLAPLAGISNLPFRLIARSFGCSLAYTEMISANGLVRKTDKTYEYLQTCAADKPLGMQIFGADPQILAAAAVIAAERGADLIDINMGCPVKKVVKSGAGAILMKDPGLIARIIVSVKKAVAVPVTVKIRSGWNRSSINAVEIARIAEDSGADAVTVHGRTADQGYSGTADWGVIAAVKKAVRIPVFGNGDIWQPRDAVAMIAQTSCDAVMVGRGVLGNPWIFTGINQLTAGRQEDCIPGLEQRYEIIKKHWSLEAEICGSRAATRSFRKHLLWYTKGLEGSSRFRNIVSALPDRENMLCELDKYFRSLAVVSSEIIP